VIIRATTLVCVFAISLAVTRLAFAGEFAVHCSYKTDGIKDCASVISDVVTEKFMAKFSSNKFEIFVHSHVSGFSDGGFAAYAVTGVVPINSGQFPVLRFSSTHINGGDKQYNRVELANLELKAYRTAVRKLMEQCEISLNCDVYAPREK
jgi:hypothetical protein